MSSNTRVEAEAVLMYRAYCPRLRCVYAPLVSSSDEAHRLAREHDSAHRCRRCGGRGEVGGGEACRECNGVGEVDVPGVVRL